MGVNEKNDTNKKQMFGGVGFDSKVSEWVGFNHLKQRLSINK